MKQDYQYWLDRNRDNVYIGLIGTTIILLIAIGFIWWSGEIDKVPTIERQVFITVAADEGETECVFMIDNKRYMTSQSPCTYEKGEWVDTKLVGNTVYIIDD